MQVSVGARRLQAALHLQPAEVELKVPEVHVARLRQVRARAEDQERLEILAVAARRVLAPLAHEAQPPEERGRVVGQGAVNGGPGCRRVLTPPGRGSLLHLGCGERPDVDLVDLRVPVRVYPSLSTSAATSLRYSETKNRMSLSSSNPMALQSVKGLVLAHRATLTVRISAVASAL